VPCGHSRVFIKRKPVDTFPNKYRLHRQKLYAMLNPSQPGSATPIVTNLTVTSENSLYLIGKIINSVFSGSGMQVAF